MDLGKFLKEEQGESFLGYVEVLDWILMGFEIFSKLVHAEEESGGKIQWIFLGWKRGRRFVD